MQVGTLRFTRRAFAKLCLIRDREDYEVAAFGVTPWWDPCTVVDLILPKQVCSWGTVEMDDDDLVILQDLADQCGVCNHQFRHLWIHTHPGESAEPSKTDTETFEDHFGEFDFAMMHILSKKGKQTITTRLRGRGWEPEEGDIFMPEPYCIITGNVAVLGNDSKIPDFVVAVEEGWEVAQWVEEFKLTTEKKSYTTVGYTWPTAGPAAQKQKATQKDSGDNTDPSKIPEVILGVEFPDAPVAGPGSGTNGSSVVSVTHKGDMWTWICGKNNVGGRMVKGQWVPASVYEECLAVRNALAANPDMYRNLEIKADNGDILRTMRPGHVAVALLGGMLGDDVSKWKFHPELPLINARYGLTAAEMARLIGMNDSLGVLASMRKIENLYRLGGASMIDDKGEVVQYDNAVLEGDWE